MELLAVENLCKRYESFALKNVSFKLDQGYIMGFIGRNGAGKTTTLKSMLNLVHADSGNVQVFGKNFMENELQNKQSIALMLGGASYYPKHKAGVIANVVRRFYSEWDDALFAKYMKRFDLNPDKKVDELSAGMKVKFALALALSHNAKLLVLDEPTSGLDPVSRDDLLELFQELIEEGDKSILFSTQITSDLEKCADYITYIKNGEIVTSTEKDDFLNSYKIIKGTNEQFAAAADKIIGFKKNAFGFSGLVRTADVPSGLEMENADIESIMIYFEREDRNRE